MSTVAEIEAALPQLSTEQLLRVEQALQQQYRQWGGILIYDKEEAQDAGPGIDP